MQREHKREFRVGLFVLLALLIGGSVAFVIGNQRNVFSSKVAYYGVFTNVDGLRSGSPVLIGGVSSGTVDGVKFRKDGKIRVEIRVNHDVSHLVRDGSVASLGNKGMLGDKLVSINVGHGKPLAPGSTIPTADASGLAAYMKQAGSILSDVKATTENLRKATGPLGDEQLGEDIRETAGHLATITRMVAEGEGPIRRFMTDRQMADNMDRGLANLADAAAELHRTAKAFRTIAEEVRSGDGSAHELIYGQEGTHLVRNLAEAAGEVATLLGEVRTGDGTLHDIVYEDEGQALIANLTQVSEDLKAISGDVRAGRGTLGGFLKDPSIYEDVKRLVGDLQRNEILRSLVRYSIKRDEQVERTEVTEP